MKESDLKTKIRKLIGEDNLDNALELLYSNTENNEKIDEIILQEARYNRVKKASTDGTVSLEESNRELNLLRKNLLSFVRSEALVIQAEPVTAAYTIKEFKTSLAISLTRLKVATVLISQYDLDTPMTIAGIINLSKLKSRKLVIDFLNELANFNLLEKKRENKSTMWKLTEEGKVLLEETYR